MRKIKILKVNASSGTPGSIEVAGDYTKIFQGKFYRHPATEVRLPAYTTPSPTVDGYVMIRATTFDLVENTKYAGRYTVYTPVSSNDIASSTYAASKTTIQVNEAITGLASGDAPELLTDGYITNISTYLLYTGSTELVIPPATNITSFPIEFMGRDSIGWGEAFAQNFVNVARNFAHPTEPTNPFTGQTWYDTDDQQLRVFNGSSWGLVNQSSYGVTHRHTQGSPSTTWVVDHMLGLPAPYVGFCQFFVDRGNGPKLIIPSDVSFDTANRLTVTFSNPEVGYVVVRQ